MLRKLLSLGNDAVGQRVGVLGLFARPAALCAVQPGGFGFCSGFHAPDESADVDLFSAVRAVHLPENNPTVAYEEAQFQSSPLPIFMLSYKDHLVGAMEFLAANPRTLICGYNTTCGGTANCFPPERRQEMPLAEALCAGVAIGMSLGGYIPILWIERMDFILHSMDQIVNHLDKLASLSNGLYKPAVIIRVAVGNKYSPLLTGPTHCQDFSLAIANMVSFPVIRLRWPDSILIEYQKALDRALSGQSTMLVEYRDLFQNT